MATANAHRRRLALPPLTHTSHGNLWATLPRRKSTARCYEYHLESALPLLLRPGSRHAQHPIHRHATLQELASGEYISYGEGCRLLGCSPARLRSHIHKLCIRALRHPITKRIWVRVRDLIAAAYYRSQSFIRRNLSEEQAEYILHTRPFIRHRCNGISRRVYFAPELVHL